MKNHKLSKLRLAIASLAAIPAIAMAVPPAGTAYYTDATNSYVQDQTSQVMGQLNNILCFMGAMAPNLMVNAGNYIALVDKNTCDSSGGSGGQSNNTGPAYLPVVVNSARASTTAPMLVKAWLTFQEQSGSKNISVYASATEAPSATLPYGVFRMDYCGNISPDTSCAGDQGFINAATSGLTFFSAYNDGVNSDTTKLILNATGSGATAGSGAISQSYSWNGGGNSNYLFSYNANYFVRNDGIGADVCFDRSPTNADESVWRYGLYDGTTGARVTRNSGFPIEYTLLGVTYNGYIGYYGIWTPGTGPASGDTVNQVTYSSSGATKTPYTLLKTGGKLMKFTTATKTLAALNKVTFWYYAQNAVGAQMSAGSQYELYWDNASNQFFVSGQQSSTSYNMEPYSAPVAVANTDMASANPYGLFGWSQMLGGQFGIKGTEFAKITSIPSTLSAADVNVVTQIQDIVYPSQFAALGNLTCINDCPTKALIDSSNASGTPLSPFENAGWNAVGSASFKTFTLNNTTGNLIDAASQAVVSTVTSGNNANGIRSGRMLATADVTADYLAMIAAKDASGVCGGTTPGTCTTFNQGDIDFLPVGKSYYVWETGGQPWNQIAILKDGAGVPVTFEAPLQVSFVVPTGAKYGSYQGATISMQYGGFGDLWGIPNECIDVTTNAACDFTPVTGTSQNNQRWTSKFSIPYDTTNGVVTAGTTTYFVKALDKEIRLAKVLCATAGLSTAGLSNAGLPDATGWTNPTSSVGTKPVVTDAPKVIHGVKQY